ncbi:hypothetical protein FZEAL_711 [Fusarium zealandicum]|uniref:N-acetyltransferase domain-containing protein n=1 Tax=Fusarium zealandicum TaxID=1053134 RepID=A0A8H4XQ58_9HYPO|nr:hypothetical protein FZEAL_711 [Fusarium zealandicum]
METMSQLQAPLPVLNVRLQLDEYQGLAVTPWYSYSVLLPNRPLPNISKRPHIKTARLVVRPVTLDDLDGLHDLRQRPKLQLHSKTRGRPNRSKDETRQHIEEMAEDEPTHWNFGAFLQSTGELIGEGGLPDCVHMVTSTSGWPEAEFFIKPEYWRQGYGTELYNAVMDSWWDLSRERRRQQLHPAVAPGKEPGDPVAEGVMFGWENGNDAALGFFSKVLANAPIFAEGGYESIDMREGREGSLVRWDGALVINPRPPREDESQSEG